MYVENPDKTHSCKYAEPQIDISNSAKNYYIFISNAMNTIKNANGMSDIQGLISYFELFMDKSYFKEYIDLSLSIDLERKKEEEKEQKQKSE